METCEFCNEVSSFAGNLASVEQHKREVHPMEYTIAGKQANDVPLDEAEKQFVANAEAKANADKAAKKATSEEDKEESKEKRTKDASEQETPAKKPATKPAKRKRNN